MEEYTFEQAMNRLDEIVSILERNEMDMETSLQLFEEGLELAKKCDNQLKSFEKKANDLLAEYQKDEKL